jgi:hypothetical protein
LDKLELEQRTLILVMIEYKGLRPGFMYLCRIRGTNVAGSGPWSDETFSVILIFFLQIFILFKFGV